jgi:hypothetical protein
MSRKVLIPSSRVLFACERVNITPPAGIFQRLWGASKHYQSTGYSRPLYADIVAFNSLGNGVEPLLLVELDMCTMTPDDYIHLVDTLKVDSSLTKNIIITFTHTHSFGWLVEPEDYYRYPGTEMIKPYIQSLSTKLANTSKKVLSNMKEATITYSIGKCNLAGNRDFWDDGAKKYVCGYNPDVQADDTVIVARVVDKQGKMLATIVNYACHPTTLAWQNTLSSPDFVGSMRDVVEQKTDAPCIFLQGASGDLAPREQYVGDIEIAEKNGRQLGYSVLSTLESMGPPEKDYQYTGYIESGAPLGVWSYVPFTPERMQQTSIFLGRRCEVNLTIKEELPTIERLKDKMNELLIIQNDALQKGDEKKAREAAAFAERCRRYISRLRKLSNSTVYPLTFYVYRMGDSFWVFIEGEIYSVLQQELRKRFPEFVIMVVTLCGSWLVGYIAPSGLYGKNIYQEQVSLLSAGSLEKLINAIVYQISNLSYSSYISKFFGGLDETEGNRT